MMTTTGAMDISFGIIQQGTAQNTLWQRLLFPISNEYPRVKLTAEPILLQQFLLSDDQIIEIEKKMFDIKKEEYLPDFEGKYIALENGKLLDSDIDFSALAKRVYEQHGYRPIFMPLVTKDERKYRIRSPKFQ